MVYKTIYNEDFNIGTTLINEIIDFSNIDYYGMKYSVNSPDIVLPYTLSLDDNRIIYEKDENRLLTTELVISSDSSSISKNVYVSLLAGNGLYENIPNGGKFVYAKEYLRPEGNNVLSLEFFNISSLKYDDIISHDDYDSPKRFGYKFIGWSLEDESSMVIDNKQLFELNEKEGIEEIKLYAVYEKFLIVTLYMNDVESFFFGSAEYQVVPYDGIKSIYISYVNGVKPTLPTLNGDEYKRFEGWSYNGHMDSLINELPDNPENDFSLYPVFKNKPVVTYSLDYFPFVFDEQIGFELSEDKKSLTRYIDLDLIYPNAPVDDKYQFVGFKTSYDSDLLLEDDLNGYINKCKQEELDTTLYLFYGRKTIIEFRPDAMYHL